MDVCDVTTLLLSVSSFIKRAAAWPALPTANACEPMCLDEVFTAFVLYHCLSYVCRFPGKLSSSPKSDEEMRTEY